MQAPPLLVARTLRRAQSVLGEAAVIDIEAGEQIVTRTVTDQPHANDKCPVMSSMLQHCRRGVIAKIQDESNE